MADPRFWTRTRASSKLIGRVFAEAEAGRYVGSNAGGRRLGSQDLEDGRRGDENRRL
ncbi:MAG: hypothetical protein ACYTE3_25400 [Planctomycetota bacterium]